MKKHLLIALACILSGLFFFGIPDTNAYAATPETLSNFDHIYYADNNPDLLAAFGYDKTLLYNHYVAAGKAEGRAARFCLQRTSVFDDLYSYYIYDFNTRDYRQVEQLRPGYYFDAARYAADNPDVAAILGNDPAVLYAHYVNYGCAEGRKAYGTSNEINAKLLVFDVIDEIITPGMTDRDKILAVHDYIVNNTYYDVVNYYAGTVPNVSYSIEGVMIKHRAVCDGYSKTFDFFMDALGIESERITGTANGGSHAWNRVKVDGIWYYIDVTWDDPTQGAAYPNYNHLRHKYFMISLEEMSIDHSTWMDLSN